MSILVNLVKKTELICLMQSLLVDENKTCRQENNLIGSSSVDINIEDFTDWYGWQPLIGEVTVTSINSQLVKYVEGNLYSCEFCLTK